MAKILIAPDSFKGCLPAAEVAAALIRGLHHQGHETRSLPLADGGEGTIEALTRADRELLHHDIHVAAGFTKGVCALALDEHTALVEVAQTAGIEDLTSHSPGVLDRSSRPVGEQMLWLKEKGFDRLVVGLGGSCTSDGGLGLLEALGFRFLDAAGQTMHAVPRSFPAIRSIERPEELPAFDLTILSDVDNPLCGPGGACHVFGPQKGLEPADIEPLDREIQRLYALLDPSFDRKLEDLPGAGAAGGIGAALLALGGDLRSGAEAILETNGVHEHLEWCDLIITGEGRSDHQTLLGKVPFTLANLGAAKGRPALLVSGAIDPDSHAELKGTFSAIFSISHGAIDLEEALAKSEQRLEQMGDDIGALLNLSRS